MILEPTTGNIRRAAECLMAGDVVAFPTETVYGLGADARSSEAVKKIFALKGRPLTNPLIVHVASFEDIFSITQAKDHPHILQRLEKLKHLWPGPLSVILPKQDSICDEVTAKGPTVAVRIPNHPIALALLKTCKIPIAAPSANRSTRLSPTTAQHVADTFSKDLDIILDGGPCAVGIESTVLSLSGERVEILRPGAVTWEQLHGLFGRDLAPYSQKRDSDSTASLSPGLQSVHYAPRTPLMFLDSVDISKLPTKVGLITFGEESSARSFSAVDQFDFCQRTCLSSQADLNEVAEKLFAVLQDYDKLQLDLIVIDSCPKMGIGLAIMDRLQRAIHTPTS